jgi:hypothetical protein
MKFIAAVLPLLALASPIIKDNHSTTIEILSNRKLAHGGKFGILLQRIDDLVDDADESAILAEKIRTVFIAFDVNLDHELTVNGQALKL